MTGKREAVQHDKRFEILKNFSLFDEDKNLLPEKNEVWLGPCTSLNLNRRNLYQYVKQNRANVKTRLIQYLDDKNITVIAEKDIINEENDNNSDKGDNSDEESSEEECFELEDSEKEITNSTTRNITKNLQKMRLDIQFKKFIRLTSCIDFCIMYWSPEQLVFYKTIVKMLTRLEIVLMKNCIIPVNQNKEIYVYSVVGNVNGKQTYSFCNMLTENVSYLYLFLTEWLKSGALVPKEIYCPCEYKIIFLVIDALNQSMSYEKYILFCFNYLENNMMTKVAGILPKCIVRINAMDVIVWIEDLHCFQNQNVKKFYEHCILYLSKISDCKKFIQTLEMIFVLSQSNCENKHCLNFRQNLIENFELQTEFNLEVPQNEHIKELLGLKVPDKIVQYFENIKVNVEHLCSKGTNFYDAPNAYFCKEFTGHLIALCGHFPLWSNVLRNKMIMQTPLPHCTPSNSVESLYADEFVLKHVSIIDSQMKFGRSEICTIDESYSNSLIEQSYLYHVENWMGLGTDDCNGINETKEVDDTINIEPNGESVAIIDHEFNSFSFSTNHELVSEKNNEKLEIKSETENDSVLSSYDKKVKAGDETMTNEQVEYENAKKLESHGYRNIELNNYDEQIKAEITNESNYIDVEDYNREIDELAVNENELLTEQLNSNVVVINLMTLMKHTHIVNGNLLGPVTYENLQISARNTCPIDSIYELIIFALLRNNSMANLFNNSFDVVDSLNIFKTMVYYIASECSIDVIYYERLRVMLQVQEKNNFDSTNNILNCACNVSRLFSILINSTCNNVRKLTCYNCNNTLEEPLSVVTLGWLNIICNGISSLEEELSSCLKDRKVFCSKCKTTEAILSCEINNFIALDVEDSYRDDIIKVLKKNPKYGHISSKSFRKFIFEIPKTIKINDKNYILMGFINFSGSNANNSIAHYCCYNYLGNKMWELHDDLLKNKVKEFNEDEHQKNVSIALLLYVKENEI